jgi:hypothetical protein
MSEPRPIVVSRRHALTLLGSTAIPGLFGGFGTGESSTAMPSTSPSMATW